MSLENFPLTATTATLNGTTHVTLVSAPPAGEARRIRRIYGISSQATARVLTLHLNDNSTVIPIWVSPSTTLGNFFNQTTQGEQDPRLDIVLSSTDQSLEMDLDNAGTNVVVAWYETLEAT